MACKWKIQQQKINLLVLRRVGERCCKTKRSQNHSIDNRKKNQLKERWCLKHHSERKIEVLTEISRKGKCIKD